ncbi:hypothetical protein OG225_32335 [Nocardia sp. NBC_01377]|uniref:hypothetical protein n=1 Tax=Nocardia sp. NBC_01377 TaxID=2903595 RepID=UPI003244DCC0
MLWNEAGSAAFCHGSARCSTTDPTLDGIASERGTSMCTSRGDRVRRLSGDGSLGGCDAVRAPISPIRSRERSFDQLAAIAADRGFGTDGQMVVDWLGKSRHPDAAEVAVAQLDDDTVAGHALDALSKLRAQGVSKQVAPFLTSKYPWYRRNAERIIRYDQS